jgi:hypothetical protein
MIKRRIIKGKRQAFLFVFAFFPLFVNAQIPGCNLDVPPFVAGGVEVTHTFGPNSNYNYDTFNIQLCSNPNYSFSNVIPMVYLGVWVPPNGPFWNPFTYKLSFSKPVNSLQFIVFGSDAGLPGVSYGAENFVFETEQANLALQSIYACNELIDGDTLFLGVGNTGDGLFSIAFDCPVYEFTISGKGGGSGSGFKICSNSITTPNLWGKVYGDTLITSTLDSVFFAAFGGVAPYEFSYKVNGGAVQTLTSNTSEAWLPAPTSNGVYTYELLQVKDGNDSIAVIACNSEHGLEVNLASTAELETIHFTLFPNPANDNVYLSESVYFTENTAFQLTDMEGRIVLETNYQIGEAIDVSALKRGLYFLRIATEKGWVTKQFVKG